MSINIWGLDAAKGDESTQVIACKNGDILTKQYGYLFIDENKLINARSCRITNLAEPTELKDAVTKEYCDNALKNKNYVGYLPTNWKDVGFEMSGFTQSRLGVNVSLTSVDDELTVDDNSREGYVDISCPEDVDVWKVSFKYNLTGQMTFPNDPKRLHCIFSVQGYRHEWITLDRHIQISSEVPDLHSEVKFLNMETNTGVIHVVLRSRDPSDYSRPRPGPSMFNKFRLMFKPFSRTRVDNIQSYIIISNFQLYVYNNK
jgi:hypothetical protein